MHDKEFKVNEDGSFSGYGYEFPKGTTEVTAHLWLYKSYKPTNVEVDAGRVITEEEYEMKWHHFKWCCDLLWNYSDSPAKVIWNPWTDKMLKSMVIQDYLSLAGCGSSGKSHAAAIFAIVEYLCYPIGTLVLLTSTTIKDAQKRVWKSVSEYWNALDDPPGRMVYSKAMITGIDKNGNQTTSTGLQIMAAGNGGADDVGKKAGQKADQLILVADELPELPMAVLTTAFSNMAQSSAEWPFKMIAMGNPNLYTDPFGKFSEPVDGWKSITENDWEWKTSRGICLRFDASRNPNIIAGKNLYPWMPSQKIIDMAKVDFGERSRVFYRMYKGFWFSDADVDTIYSESDFILADAHREMSDEEKKNVVRSVGFGGGDPSYTQGGDRFPIVWGYAHEMRNGKHRIEIKGIHYLKEDVTDNSKPRSHAMVEQMRDFCEKNNIPPENFGYDMTGAGIPFRDVVVSEWSSLPVGVNFGGNASDLQISPVDQRKASDVYDNRVTELWVRGKGMVREGAFRGIPHEIIDEICQRRWHDRMGRKLKIESKVDMKARTGRSPDIADAFFILLEVIVRKGLISQFEQEKLYSRATPIWEKIVDIHDVVMHSDIDLEYD